MTKFPQDPSPPPIGDDGSNVNHQSQPMNSESAHDPALGVLQPQDSVTEDNVETTVSVAGALGPVASESVGDLLEAAEVPAGKDVRPGDSLTAAPTGAPIIPGLHRERYLPNTHVVVVGGGPIGLWIAWYSALHGAKVTVIDDEKNPTYLVAAGWCFPYHSTDPVAVPWSIESARMWALHEPYLPEGAVRREHTRVERSAKAAPFPAEYAKLPGYRALTSDELSPGMKSGFESESLVIPAQIWHPAMRRTLESLGVVWVKRHIATVDEFEDLQVKLEANFVVDAMGIFSAFVFDDPKFKPLRGTVLDFVLPENYEHGVRSWDLERSDYQDPYAVPLRSLGILRVGGETQPISQAHAE